eukprot:gnl/TRDRNA2_/TRDRNA2_152976_c0_seq1.p1 gnl/TRDRNA2_/TRDRNA2_152976_c0~~gnl/TRDRNA2_/TRDRNA2_152976_c0_seq1.p1  ORF type:complete len:136 (-),score=45.60 gnl/TRDRNA2_/TRDRNA2_152976_c0_seq1:120-527(-)
MDTLAPHFVEANAQQDEQDEKEAEEAAAADAGAGGAAAEQEAEGEIKNASKEEIEEAQAAAKQELEKPEHGDEVNQAANVAQQQAKTGSMPASALAAAVGLTATATGRQPAMPYHSCSGKSFRREVLWDFLNVSA